jgi:hypothetical protein
MTSGSRFVCSIHHIISPTNVSIFLLTVFWDSLSPPSTSVVKTVINHLNISPQDINFGSYN